MDIWQIVLDGNSAKDLRPH